MAAAATAQLDRLRRPSGAFAMLAIDQRESMRAMFAEKQDGPVTDRQLGDFKIAALKALTPHASAALIDRPFAWARAIREQAVSPNCGLIAAADHFIPRSDELVGDVVIDEEVDPHQVARDGAAAMKLLVPWRPDEPPAPRIALVETFVERCRRAGLASIIEPVSRKPGDGKAWDAPAGILAAARELGARGADLYKAEVPNYGKGGEAVVRRQAAELSKLVRGPWVCLSSGVAPDDFPQAVAWACKEGASGFLAGRAVWRSVIGAADVERALEEDALPRLMKLCEVVDAAL